MIGQQFHGPHQRIRCNHRLSFGRAFAAQVEAARAFQTPESAFSLVIIKLNGLLNDLQKLPKFLSKIFEMPVVNGVQNNSVGGLTICWDR